MNLEDKIKKANEEALELLHTKENKPEAIVEAMEKIVEAKYGDLIKSIKEEAEKASVDAQYAKSLGLRVLSKEEKEFYSAFKDIKQAITASQVDFIPTSIVDRTLEDVKKESGVLKLVSFAPADVKKWMTAEKSGTFAWGSLTGVISGELSATLAGLNVELAKLTCYLIIPKAIRDLALPYVDKYFSAILKEVINDGLEYGFLQGNGDDAPIGIYKSIANSTNGIHDDKVASTAIVSFTPKILAPVKKGLSKNGKRTIDKIYLLCNPNDQADYVDPALFDRQGNMVGSYKNMEVIASANNPTGLAAFVLEGKYAMGFSGLQIKEYDQTKALDDADVVIAKVYANGRAVDDTVAFVFDVTRLAEYIPSIKIDGTVITDEAGDIDVSVEGPVNILTATFPSLTVASAEGQVSGKTAITVTETIGAGNSYKYKVTDAEPAIPNYNSKSVGYTAWNGTAEITAVTGKKIAIIETDSSNRIKAFGTATVASKA